MFADKIFGFTPITRRGAPVLQVGRKQNLNWELFGHSPLNAANFYWRLPHGLRSANAIESSTRPAHDKREQYLCA